MPGYRHSVIVNAPPEKVLERLDFGALAKALKMDVTGDPNGVGSFRRGPAAGGAPNETLTETQVLLGRPLANKPSKTKAR